MSSMVFISEISADSFLHYSPRGSSFRLTKFSRDDKGNPRKTPVMSQKNFNKYTCHDIDRLSTTGRNCKIAAPDYDRDDPSHLPSWCDYVSELNNCLNIDNLDDRYDALSRIRFRLRTPVTQSQDDLPRRIEQLIRNEGSFEDIATLMSRIRALLHAARRPKAPSVAASPSGGTNTTGCAGEASRNSRESTAIKVTRSQVDESPPCLSKFGSSPMELEGEAIPGASLVSRFKDAVKPLIDCERETELKEFIDLWHKKLACVKNKEGQFNHWDKDDASQSKETRTGIGYAAQMLEFCRKDQQLNFIRVTGCEDLDFALLSMDLHLGISAKKNFFCKGRRDFVKPDGLGVRRDASFCVLEIKGPQDQGDLYEATLQALCGALAVHAKQANLRYISKRKNGRRPAVDMPEASGMDDPVSVYVLVSHEKVTFDPRISDKMRMLVRCFPGLKEIVHFVLDFEAENAFKCLPKPERYTC